MHVGGFVRILRNTAGLGAWWDMCQALGLDAICMVRKRIGFGGAGFGFGSVCLGPGSGSVRFRQARSGFGSDLSAQFRFSNHSESDRFGIGSDSALKTGAMPMRDADAMAVEMQLFTNRCLMKTTGLPFCLPIARFADYCGCGMLY